MYQCDKKIKDWFLSYLQGRGQCAQFKGKYLTQCQLLLGPLLFILFMNDLPLHVDSSTDMYADDFTLCETGETVE